jgi:hypothetical protein
MIILHGARGLVANNELWSRILNAMGVVDGVVRDIVEEPLWCLVMLR